MRQTEVKLRADVRYGLDDLTLWPQPWVECTVTWVPFPENPTIPMTVLQLCGGTQPVMTWLPEHSSSRNTTYLSLSLQQIPFYRPFPSFSDSFVQILCVKSGTQGRIIILHIVATTSL